jgi:hypothetical protein
MKMKNRNPKSQFWNLTSRPLMALENLEERNRQGELNQDTSEDED